MSPHHGLSILIVEDHPNGADSLATVLTLHGHRTRVARSCDEATQAVGTFAPDAVLMDIGLPDGDGYWLATKLANLLSRRPLMIALTGHNGLAVRSQLAGLDHHLIKPVDPQALAGLLDAYAKRLTTRPT